MSHDPWFLVFLLLFVTFLVMGIIASVKTLWRYLR